MQNVVAQNHTPLEPQRPDIEYKNILGHHTNRFCSHRFFHNATESKVCMEFIRDI